jgi:excisionase family DNA binding protein
MLPRPTQPQRPSLLTVNDVAEQLQLSTKTIRRMIQAGTLPCHRIGRAIRVAPKDVAILVHLAHELPTT